MNRADLPAPWSHSLRILVVSNDPGTREAVCDSLCRLEFSAELATDAERGFCRAFERPPDVALVDLTLPSGGGYQLAERLRAVLGRYVLLIGLHAAGGPEGCEELHFTFDDIVDPTDLEALRRWCDAARSEAHWEAAPYCCYWEGSSDATAWRTIVGLVTGEMAEQGYAEPDVFAVRLALDETVVNAVKHGNRGDPAKRVRVRYHVGPDRVLVEVEDEGDGFDPKRVPDPTVADNLERPGGRGLLLVRSSVSWVRYHGRGNRVSFCKYRSESAAGTSPGPVSRRTCRVAQPSH